MRGAGLLVVVVALCLAIAPACLGATQSIAGSGGAPGAPAASVRVVQASSVEPALVRARASGPSGPVAARAVVRAGDPQAVVVTSAAPVPGRYELAWWGMTIDGHPIAGTTAVDVGRATPAAPVTPDGREGIGALGMLARLLVLVGVLGSAGMAFTREWVVAGAWSAGGIAAPGQHVADGVRAAASAVAAGPVRAWWATWWGLLGAWAIGLVLALPVQALAVGGQWGALLGDSRWGVAWIGLAILVVAAALGALAARQPDRLLRPAGARVYALAVPGAIGAMLLSWSGHAGSGTDATLGVVFDIAHGWATAAWLGGLLMLLVLGMPLIRRMGDPDRVRFGAAVVVRFSAVAVVAVVVLVVTGIYRALAELPSPDALWTTDYGVALLAKLIVFVVMLVLAAWNRLVLHPRLERVALGLDDGGRGDGLAALRGSVRAEVALGAAVMVAVAVLVALVPPT